MNWLKVYSKCRAVFVLVVDCILPSVNTPGSMSRSCAAPRTTNIRNINKDFHFLLCVLLSSCLSSWPLAGAGCPCQGLRGGAWTCCPDSASAWREGEEGEEGEPSHSHL